MTATDVLELLNILHNHHIPVWIDGGWGVDALLGKQTRPHSDLDVVVSLEDVKKIQQILKDNNFTVTEDELPTRFVMKDNNGKEIDFHTVSFDEEGGGNQTLQDGRVWRCAPEGFKGTGMIKGERVKCLSAEIQAATHYGYEPDEKDKHDMKLLHEIFHIQLKPPYKKTAD